MSNILKYGASAKSPRLIQKLFRTITSKTIRNHPFALFPNKNISSNIDTVITELMKRKLLLQSHQEAAQLYQLAKEFKRMSGDYAEVGTYKGGSSFLISITKGEKSLHL